MYFLVIESNDFIFNHLESKVLLKPMLGSLACSAYFIIGNKKKTVLQGLLFSFLYFFFLYSKDLIIQK